MLETFNMAKSVVKPAVEEDANKSAFTTANRTTTAIPTTNSSPIKAKTLFNWFRGGNTKQTNAPTTKDSKADRVHTGNRTKSLSPSTIHPPATASTIASERDVTLGEFRGVQSLRHLWNKRISASENATRRQSTLSDSKKSKLTKSIGCLVHAATDASTQATNSLADADGVDLRQKRAHSLHDCTQVGVRDEVNAAVVNCNLEIDYLHREKDNFYKYKTAEQAAKHLAREARVRNKVMRRVTAGIVSSETCDEDAHFPAVKASERGERIHWLRREDMMTRRRENTEMPAGREITMAASVDMLSADNVVIHEAVEKIAMPKTSETELLAITQANAGQEHRYPTDSSDNDTRTANNSPRHTVSRKRNAQRETSHTTIAKRCSSDSNKSNSLTLSASGSLTNGTTAGGRSARRTTSSASSTSSVSARKYSFKTHTRTYHTPRKMSQRDSGGTGCGGGGSTSAFVPAGGNIVAKLTQQFNEMIQKDKKLLEEVKRKNGVLMSRGGHVYKVVENPLALTADGDGKRTSPSVSRNSSRGQDAATSVRASTVQRNIKKFECGRGVVNDKPVVPVKSAQVLQKLRELNKIPQSSLKNGGANGGFKRFHHTLPTPTTPNELQLKLELKKAQLALPLSPPLEVVKEESKTPMEAYEKSIAPSQLEDGVICAQASVNVSNVKSAENTNVNESATKTLNQVELKNVDARRQSYELINEGLNCCDAQVLINSNVNAVENDIKNSVGQITVSEETNDAESHKICIAATPNETIKTKAIKTEVEGNANAELGIPTSVTTIQTADDVERTKTNDTITTPPTSCAMSTKETMQANGIIDTNDDKLNAVNDEANDEKTKQRKHKYAKIYEKFRFRSPFVGGGQHNKKLSAKQQATTVEANEGLERPAAELAEDAVKMLGATASENIETHAGTSKPTMTWIPTEISPLTLKSSNETDKIMKDNSTSDTTNIAPPTSTIEPESKLLDAVELIDHKVKDLTVDEDEENTAALLLSPDDDFEQRVLPNNSFVFQASTKQVANNKLIVAQAVNVALVNSIEGEQMILEQKELQRQQCDYSEMVRPLSIKMEQPVLVEIGANKQREQPTTINEPIYEPIGAQCDVIKTEEFERKTEQITTEMLYSKTCAIGAQQERVETDEPFVENAITHECEKIQIFEDIYQTVDEAKATAAQALAEATNAALLADYESIAGSSEHTTPAATTATLNYTIKALYDGYEICEPPTDAPHATPSMIALPSIVSTPSSGTPKLLQQTSTGGGNVRNTTDELPELPKPKRRLPKSPMPGKRSPKSGNRTATTTTRNDLNHTAAGGCSKISNNSIITTALDDHDDDHHYYADDENIYDTIKSSHCYESMHAASIALQKSSSTSTKCGSDSISVTSNCYESISHYRRASHSNSVSGGGGGGGGHLGSSSGSTLTISSDHKTNSLYEMSVTTSMIYGTGSVSSRQLVTEKSSGGCISGRMAGINDNASDVNSDGSASVKHYYQMNGGAVSDNSDEWVDISDPEAEGAAKLAKPQFIVVRERSKVHRSPDWSKRVRDKRLNQKKAISCIEDDSDHYYETLSPLGNKRHSTLPVQRTNSHHKRSQGLPHFPKNGTQSGKQYSASMHGLGTLTTSDDYDSFDTDTDDIYEVDENIKNTDSGVDIRHVKLPDPPAATNQVYAIVRKLKNFISNKKSPGSQSKYGGSQQKLYENSTQFYVSGASNIYENTPKTKSKAPKNVKKATATPQEQDIYENTEFHSPLAITGTDEKQQINTTEKVSSSPTDAKFIDTSNTSTTLRSKSKSSKSFKSRLRKSLVGSTFDMKHLTTLTPARSTFYIEDPTYGGSGELDSGFSEKTSSGDLPTASTVPTPETQKFSTVARKAKKEAKVTNSQRRRTIIGIRPQDPPPPPPVVSSTTSWYAECGVFKNGTNSVQEESEISLNDSKASQNGSSGLNGSSWYTEAGLYQTSGVSVASSSGSSGVSTGNEGALSDDLPHSMFQNEPLYQIYSAAKLESITRDMEGHDSSTDGYEEIGQNGTTNEARISSQKHQRPSAFQLIEPKNGPSRTLWSEIPEVINSCVLATLTPRERSLQEAKFEIITSEASYLKSLNLLRSHFMNHPIFRDTNVVSARDRKALFAYIVPVHECSEKLLTEMESCWQDNIMLIGLSKRIYNVAEKYFHVYIAFCEHQGRMDRTLRRLKESRGIFAQNLQLLETSANCCGLNLHSFLMLPMQRITRLPLLIDAVFSKVSPNDDEYENWKMTLAIMNKIVTQCNEAANRCEQAYEIERIARQLEFPSTIRALAIAPVGVSAPGSKPRFLVKRGELTHFIWRGDDVKLTFGKKFSKVPIYAFLFSDLLVLTKRKGEEQFTVFDYCPRSMLTITSGDMRDISQTHKNLILMTLLENHERKTVELLLSCPSVSEQERWLQAVRPPEPETPGEKLYAPWDCPQVIAKHVYETREPDALSLEVGDVINVTRKLPDGWYQGERIRDGVVGWFPGSYTEEVNSAHVRARNLKQRQRLLTFTASYLESQKRK